MKPAVLIDYAALAAESRARQGLPPKVTDPQTLATVAALINAGSCGGDATRPDRVGVTPGAAGSAKKKTSAA
jgi:hypothetical protein